MTRSGRSSLRRLNVAQRSPSCSHTTRQPTGSPPAPDTSSTSTNARRSRSGAGSDVRSTARKPRVCAGRFRPSASPALNRSNRRTRPPSRATQPTTRSSAPRSAPAPTCSSATTATSCPTAKQARTSTSMRTARSSRSRSDASSTSTSPPSTGLCHPRRPTHRSPPAAPHLTHTAPEGVQWRGTGPAIGMRYPQSRCVSQAGSANVPALPASAAGGEGEGSARAAIASAPARSSSLATCA